GCRSLSPTPRDPCFLPVFVHPAVIPEPGQSGYNAWAPLALQETRHATCGEIDLAGLVQPEGRQLHGSGGGSPCLFPLFRGIASPPIHFRRRVDPGRRLDLVSAPLGALV